MEHLHWLSDEYRKFLVISEAGSLSAAARKSGHDIGNLSRSLAKLEVRIGTPLFNRHQSGLTLTHRGQELQEALLSGTRAFESSIRSEISKPIKIGFSPTIGFGFFAPFFLPVLDLQKFVPEFTLAPSLELYKLLKDRRIDLILSPRLPKFPDVVSAALFDTKLVLCSKSGHPTRRLIRSQQLFDLEKRLAGLDIDETIILDDSFVAAKFISESEDFMGIIPECILENFPGLKVLEHRFQDEKVFAITWRGSPGMNVLKEVRSRLRKP